MGIEFGYLHAHRAGWNLAAVGLVGSAGATLALALVSAAFFDEPLTARQMLGIACRLVGMAFPTRHTH